MWKSLVLIFGLFPVALRRGLVLALAGLLLWTVSPGQASSSIVVNSHQDAKKGNDGLCSLREAIIAANSDKQSGGKPGECEPGAGDDTIILPPGTYTLTRSDSGKEDASQTGDLDIIGNVNLQGAPGVVIDASGINDRVFHILSDSVTMTDVVIVNGNISGDGGGVYNLGHLTLDRVAFAGNSAGGKGGAIYNDASATLVATNATISGNSAAGEAGGIFNAGLATLNSLTLADNSANSGGGLVNDNGIVELGHSIVAGNFAGQAADCAGEITSLGYNLIEDNSDCTIIGEAAGNIFGQDPLLGALEDDGSGTLTHALPLTSPAMEAGAGTCLPAGTDQRGISRPRGLVCDIGAYEVENPAQPGPIFTVNTASDMDDGICGFSHCSLREAINAANARPNGATADEIHFDIPPEEESVIAPDLILPEISDPVVIDGRTQPGSNQVILDGVNALDDANPEEVVNGLVVAAGNSAIHGLEIVNFSGSGILLKDGDNNTVAENSITNNDGAGVSIIGSTGNAIQGNDIHDNGGLPIDLGGDGMTPNDEGDGDIGANFVQNFPVLNRAVPDAGGTGVTVEGRLNSTALTTFNLEFFATEDCSGSGSQTQLGSEEDTTVTTDEVGNQYFNITLNSAVSQGQFIVATATDPDGNTSEFSACVSVGPDNDSWPLALQIDHLFSSPAVVEQHIDTLGQSRWFKFSVEPNSKVIVTLTDLPENYDLTLYKDIQGAFDDLSTPEDAADLALLGAEFAPDAFAPDAFAPDAFAPDAFAPDAFAPDAFAPDAFAPDAFAPDAFAPDAFAPDAFAPDAFAPDAFASAQIRSLVGVSAFEGPAGEGLRVNSWNETGEFYVRVRGRNGAFNVAQPFHLEVTVVPGSCDQVDPITIPSTIEAVAGNKKTIILTDFSRLPGTAAEKQALRDRLIDELASRPEVGGVVVDVGLDDRVAEANSQADGNLACPYAKNLVAGAIKEIVEAYANLNPLEFVVIVGGDDVIPFFRHPDNALLANEQNYVPPVLNSTASQASLRLGYVLSQDAYGSELALSLNNSTFPVPGLAVGRLVETIDDINSMLDGYELTSGGVVSPTSSLVTGYDFLEDAALEVQDQLEAGIGAPSDALITPRDISPTGPKDPNDPFPWTADQLRNQLLGSRHDLIFLAGHFSANSALAADYTTRLRAEEVRDQTDIDLNNVIVFSAGCHAGYNIVNQHGVPNITREPDWAQAFAQQGAVLIAGTGYQYGDTDFLKYSELLYLEFSKELRANTGSPVSVGQALVNAKRAYMAQTPRLSGLDEKSLLEATIFGLPMLSVHLPGGLDESAEESIISSLNPISSTLGTVLGLSYADISVTSPLAENIVLLENIEDGSQLQASYLSGTGGKISTKPAEPALPLEIENVTVISTTLRGVGFRGGSYSEEDVLPLIGAPTTEMRGVHTPFLSDVFYPVLPWRVNYFDALDGGDTRLMVTPAQHKTSPALTDPQLSTRRQFSDMDFRLYYNNNVQSFANGSTPALAAPPDIVQVSASPGSNEVNFKVNVVGNPAAGIHEAWITYTVCPEFALACNGEWVSLDLTQNDSDSTLWEGSLTLNGNAWPDIRYIVQAVNGVGLVSLDTNLGAYYIPAFDMEPTMPTELVIQSIQPPGSGPYGTQATFLATLTSDEAPATLLSNQVVSFRLGSQSRQAVTDDSGNATVDMSLLALPGLDEVKASFAGTGDLIPSTATEPFIITKQITMINLDPPAASVFPDEDSGIVATLSDATGRRLVEKTVIFEVTGANGTFRKAEITDFAGRAPLGPVPLPRGEYSVIVRFAQVTGDINLADDRYESAATTGLLTLENRPPGIAGDEATTREDMAIVVDVLANDTDADEDILSVVELIQPVHGLVVNNILNVTYTPDPDYCGSDAFTYTAGDGSGGSGAATVNLEITCVNDAPVAVDDSYSVDEDGVLEVLATGVISNDIDVDGDLLSAVLVSGPTNGLLSLDAVGSFTYTPQTNFNGQDTFTYKASDGALESNETTVTITVNSINDLPDCSQAASNILSIWPPDGSFHSAKIVGVTDLEDETVTITIIQIYQDEPTGKGKSGQDANILDEPNAFEVRAERDGKGDGRVYYVDFVAQDDAGGACSGTVRLGVLPHDQSGDLDAIDSGPPYYDSVSGKVIDP